MARSTASKTAERERRQQGEGLAQEPAGRPTPFGSHGDIVGLQRAAGNRAVDGLLGGTQRQVPPIVDEVLRSGTGQPLDTATREFMGSRFGEDFSQVRVHTDARAAESAQAINAQAYTAGRDVVFGTGQYAPATPKGRWVLAHELAHVVQQNAAGAQTRPEVSQAGDPFERSADAAAQHLTSHSQMDGHASSVLGRSVASAGHSMPPAIQRLSTERRQRDDRDVLEAELTETLYGQPQYFETGLLIHHARLLHSKSQSAGSLTRAAAARSLVGFYQILREREETASRDAEGALLRSYLGDLVPWTEEKPRSLNDIAPFSPRNVLQWFASAADWPQPRTAGSGGKPGSLSKPPPFLEKPAEALTRIGATVEDQPLSDYELSSGKTGGGTDIERGIAALRGTTTEQVLSLLAAGMTESRTKRGSAQGVEAVGQNKAPLTLYEATGEIWYVGNRLYVLDRTGHIVRGDFALHLGSSSLQAGATYFYSKFDITDTTYQAETGGLLRVDGGLSVAAAQPDLSTLSVLEKLTLVGRGQHMIERKAGVAIIVSSAFGQGGGELRTPLDVDLNKVLRAIHRAATHHLEWAVTTELLERKQNLTAEIVQQAVGEGIAYVARYVPPIGVILSLRDAALLGEWLGTTASIAGHARTDDEIDIAAQSIARRLAAWLVGKVVSGVTEGLKSGVKAGAKHVGEQLKAKPGTTPPAVGLSEGQAPPASDSSEGVGVAATPPSTETTQPATSAQPPTAVATPKPAAEPIPGPAKKIEETTPRSPEGGGIQPARTSQAGHGPKLLEAPRGNITSAKNVKNPDRDTYELKKASSHPDDQAEVRMAERLRADGDQVHFTSEAHGDPDLIVNGIGTDVKHPSSTDPNNIRNAIQRGKKQGAHVILDGTTVNLTREQALAGIQEFERVAQKHPGPVAQMRRIEIVLGDGSKVIHYRDELLMPRRGIHGPHAGPPR